MLCLAIPSIADDLEDKIGKYTDDDIQADHTMDEGTPNVKFIKMNAKSKAKVRQKAAGKNKTDQSKNGKTSSKSKDANMNSVVLGAGSNIKGDIIIIDESKGDKVNIGGK